MNVATTALDQQGVESYQFATQPAARRMVFVYAHPDDETFANAGTIARYSAAGVDWRPGDAHETDLWAGLAVEDEP